MRWIMAAVVLVGLLAAPGLATWSENFDSYPLGGLDPQSGGVWVGSNDVGPTQTTGVIDVASDQSLSPDNSAKITHGGAATNMVATATVNQNPVNSKLLTTAYIRGSKEATYNAWYIEYRSEVGTYGLGDWYGGASNARPRIDGLSGDRVGTNSTLTGGWDELKTEIDFSTGYTKYWFNGTQVGNLRWGDDPAGMGTKLVTVALRRYANSGKDGKYIWFDDMSVTPEPTALILLGLGGLLGLRRRR